MTKEPSIEEREKRVYKLLTTGIDPDTGKEASDWYMGSELHSLLEAYAKEQREICADEARIRWTDELFEINKDSIRNAPSPTEKQ